METFLNEYHFDENQAGSLQPPQTFLASFFGHGRVMVALRRMTVGTSGVLFQIHWEIQQAFWGEVPCHLRKPLEDSLFV